VVKEHTMKDNKQLIEQLGQMSVAELVELTHRLEETWGVSASDALVQIVRPDPDKLTTPDEPSEYDLVLLAIGRSRLHVIRLIREVTGLILQESVALATELPSVIRSGLEPEVARDLVARFEELGADVELR
jgi:large subunit ribosomal protein L7/L12